jgi:2-polyprenyl-6-methoxyphenol hydroxylase-like FAD-dependent oxidoreductase
VKAKTDQGDLEVRADLVVGADGRHSTIRERAGMKVEDFGVPIDVLWYRLSKSADEPSAVLGRVRNGRILVTIDRGDYFQCGSIIPKGAFDEIQRQGLEAFRAGIVSAAPFLADTVHELDSWDKVKLLTVQVNRLQKWYRPGLLCIGDAAHAMSPAGGVGINLALQDAVATANLLAARLRTGSVSVADLELVQKRREWPTCLIQAMQAFIHRNVVTGRESKSGDSLPILLRLFQWFPALRSLPARFIGIGPRSEHIRSPAAD